MKSRSHIGLPLLPGSLRIQGRFMHDKSSELRELCLAAITVALSGCPGYGEFAVLDHDYLMSTSVFGGNAMTPAKSDADDDRVEDLRDNCANTPNADQADVDKDGMGDVCDPAPEINNAVGGVAPPVGWEGAAARFADDVAAPAAPGTDSGGLDISMCRVCGCHAPEEMNQLARSGNPILVVRSADGSTVAAVAKVNAKVRDRYPAIHLDVPSDQMHSLQGIIDRHGMGHFLRDYVELCDDANSDGQCGADEASHRYAGEGSSKTAKDLDRTSDRHPLLLTYGMEVDAGRDCHMDVDELPKGCDVFKASPLVLDQAGDGVLASDLAVLFDINADGILDNVGWVLGEDDALLALDLNQNGLIDDGRELFGNATQLGYGVASHGLEALAQHDSNGDGAITEEDPVFADLRLWHDTNMDGQSETDELSTLLEKNIRSLNLEDESTEKHETDDFGNESRQRSSFDIGGAGHLMVDIWFVTLTGT